MKLKRHEKIIELIEQYDIETQDELAELLRKEGIDVTQATVSRDIRKLALSKVPGKNGRQKYALLNRSIYDSINLRVLYSVFFFSALFSSILTSANALRTAILIASVMSCCVSSLFCTLHTFFPTS